MKFCDIVKLETARTELEALVTLLEHELPQELMIDVITKAARLMDEVIHSGVEEDSTPKDVGFENLVQLIKNIVEG